jgi:uncharacterized membrane protein
VARYEVQREIEAPPEKVWAVMDDVETWPQWTKSIVSIERLDDAPFGMGSRVRIRQPKLPSAIWRVSAYEPNRYFAWTTKGTGITGVAGHRIEPLGPGRSRVTLTVDNKGLLAPIIGVIYRKLSLYYMNMEADGLKRRSES